MYNNPIFFQQPNIKLTKTSIFNFNELLNKTQRTLNIVNQALPIFYQIKPLWNNTKTILKIANIINEKPKETRKQTVNQSDKKNEIEKNTKQTLKKQYNEPVFFL